MYKTCKVGLLSLLLTAAASAATVSFDFTNGSSTGGPDGNSKTYTNGIYSVVATSFSLAGNLAGNFATAQLDQYNSLGLGVCDRFETCSNPEHQVDNHGYDDFVLFKFYVSGVLTAVDPASIVINPYGTYDRDVTYYIGNSTTNLSTIGLAGLSGAGFGGRNDDDSTVSGNSRSVSLGGGNGNELLFGARLSGNHADDHLDCFKIESLTISTVATPEPATFGLAGIALLGLGLIRNRRKS
jgi:hypothetical protein